MVSSKWTASHRMRPPHLTDRKEHIAISANTNAPATAAEKKPRGPLVLAKPIKNTLTGSTLVKAARSQQIHVLPADTTTTLCGINVTKWAEQADVDAATTNCPLCASAVKAATAKAAEQHITEPAPAKPSRRRKKAGTAEPQVADVGAESAAAVS